MPDPGEAPLTYGEAIDILIEHAENWVRYLEIRTKYPMLYNVGAVQEEITLLQAALNTAKGGPRND